jgi:cell division protein FtsL
MFQFRLVACLLTTIRGQLRELRSDRGSISVEQVLITAGLVGVTVVAIAALTVGVAKYAARI